MEAVFDIDSQYQLTDEDRANGWTVEIGSLHIAYYLNGLLHSLSPSQPAYRIWWKSGQLRSERHFKNGKRHSFSPSHPSYRAWWEDGTKRCEENRKNDQLHDPLPGHPAYRSWYKNKAKSLEQHWLDGRHISTVNWLEDGRQEDYIL